MLVQKQIWRNKFGGGGEVLVTTSLLHIRTKLLLSSIFLITKQEFIFVSIPSLDSQHSQPGLQTFLLCPHQGWRKEAANDPQKLANWIMENMQTHIKRVPCSCNAPQKIRTGLEPCEAQPAPCCGLCKVERAGPAGPSPPEGPALPSCMPPHRNVGPSVSVSNRGVTVWGLGMTSYNLSLN